MGRMSDAAYAARKEVARVHRELYRALEQGDLAAMEALWADDECVRCVHPGGEALVGREAVLASWRAIFASPGTLRVALEDVAVELRGDVAWVSCVERLRQTLDDERYESAAAATNLFVRAADGWRLVCHHASPIQRRFFGG